MSKQRQTKGSTENFVCGTAKNTEHNTLFHRRRNLREATNGICEAFRAFSLSFSGRGSATSKASGQMETSK